ncbi:mitochondrial carrier domain-containing protein [Limtongia smithiae]|uniref:mitochondrial carrier domain-containing protein n=1 Tax=Limtongia smithiae TaxID=1125753 RepID=UPI0034D01575
MKETNESTPQSPLFHGVTVDAVAGLAAGCATTLIVHPLDLIKVRLQIDDSHRSPMGGIANVVRDLRHSQRPLQEIYRGLMPNLVGNTVSWGSYFMWYEYLKDKMGDFYGRKDLRFADYLVCSGASGCLTALFTNPIWVVKTRMLSTASTYQDAYKSMSQGFRQIARNEGMRGFYRGFLASLFGVGHGAIQIMFYEEMKRYYVGQANSNDQKLSTPQYITFSAASKIGASLIMYPSQVIRSRLQRYDADNVYLSMRDVIAKTARQEGILGFYKGRLTPLRILPNLVRVVPATCVTFVVYEHTRSYMRYT